MNSAELNIIFCTYSEHPKFTEFMIDDKYFSTSKEEINLNIPFDDYEKDLGKKICEYKLFTENRAYNLGGLFEIYLGYNIGYCYIDNIGTTFQLLFLQQVEKLEHFKNCNFTSSILDAWYFQVEIKLSLNQINTKDRASLILINCLPYTFIKKNGEIFMDSEKIRARINSFSHYDSYQLCFHNDDFDNFAYKTITQLDKLNFEFLYEKYNENVDETFNKLLDGIKREDQSAIKDIMLIYNENKNEFENIIKRNFIFGKIILEEKLNKENYFDFMFKIIFLTMIKENIDSNHDINFDEFNDIYFKLLENKNEISNDNSLKIYEKIFLLIDLYFLKLLDKSDYKIHYFHFNNVKKDTPLFCAYKFLNNFIDKLDYESRFYYPLLLIDGDNYYYKYIKENYIRFIKFYGFNMLSLDEIKNHLKKMIPNIILFSDYLNWDESSIINPITGNIILNPSFFKNRNILKSILIENNSQYIFIIVKNLLYQLFIKRKIIDNKSEIEENPIIAFKNELGELQLLLENNDDILKDISQITNDEDIHNYKRFSLYFFRYFLGKIEKQYTLALINSIENHIDLSKLLEPELWHKDFQTIQEYIKLVIIIINLIPGINFKEFDNKLGIKDQIKLMKSKVLEKKMKNENKKNELKLLNEQEENEIINEIFNEIIKKGILMKNNNGDYYEFNSKKRILKGFLNGFYKK